VIDAAANARRSRHERRVLDLLLDGGPLSRPELAEAIGISKPAMAELIARLMGSGWVEEVGKSESRKSGPNAMRYAITYGLAIVAGVELQPTRATVRIADLTGPTLGESDVEALGGESPTELARRAMTAALPDGMEITDLATVVFATPGIVDSTGDMVYVSGYPSWTTGQLSAVTAGLRVPVRFENDTNLAALAELRYGAGAGAADFALIRADEGIGLAIVLDGRLVRGTSGAAGEIGYLPLGTDAPSTVDSRHYGEGFQSLVGMRALEAFALGCAGTDDVVALLSGEAGDPAGRLAFEAEVARRFALGIASICAVVDPGVVVLTGPVSRAGGTALAARIAAAVATSSPFRPDVRVSELQGSAVVIGAVASAHASARDELFGIAPVFLRSALAIARPATAALAAARPKNSISAVPIPTK